MRGHRIVAVASAFAAALLAAALVVVPGGTASAHDRVVASVPASGSTLTRLPARFSITTDQPMLAIGGSTSGFAFDVVDARGRHYGDGCIKVVDRVMTTRAALGAPGPYTVRWQLVSADGHTVSDGFPFTWAPASPTRPSAGHATAPRCGQGGAESTVAPPVDGGSGRGTAVPLADILWIGGGVLVVLAAGAVALVILTRRPRGGPR